MTEREFIKKIKEELVSCYQYLDEEKQAAADMGELLGMVEIYLEMQGEGDEEDEEH